MVCGVVLIVVVNPRKCECDRKHRECSRADRTGGRTNGRGKRIESGPTASVVPMSCLICATVVFRSYWWSWAAFRARDREQKTLYHNSRASM